MPSPLKRLAIGLVVICAFLPALAAEAEDRTLSFVHTHTSQRLTVTYYQDGDYVPAALDELNQFLFDFRTGEAIEMDPALFDFLHALQQATSSSGTFEVISAYRTPQTNEMLRRRNSGVAKRSQHLMGKAIDVRLSDVDTAELRRAALAMKRGGVGYYPRSDFIHIDTARVRSW
jgi:uncharacterized protein YcbK (DUF882 family)